jgi:hypothetical protein
LWRAPWFARLIGLAFASGVLLTAGADYFINHVGTPDDGPLASSDPVAGGANEAFATQAISAFRAFDRPAGAAGLSPKDQGPEPELAAPILPNLPLDTLKLAGIRAMPGEQGQMLCMFYTRPAAGNLALCVEKTPGPSDAIARLSGNFPSAAISWRQKGANYALAGALPDQELRALADVIRAQVEAFDGN